MSRLTIDISEQQHKALKAMAALQGKTIKEYAVERLFPGVATDEQALEELRQLLEQRLAEAGRGAVSKKNITQIAQEIVGAESA
jgi:hypothetical protein